jgi:hypothetical protein
VCACTAVCAFPCALRVVRARCACVHACVSISYMYIYMHAHVCVRVVRACVRAVCFCRVCIHGGLRSHEYPTRAAPERELLQLGRAPFERRQHRVCQLRAPAASSHRPL